MLFSSYTSTSKQQTSRVKFDRERNREKRKERDVSVVDDGREKKNRMNEMRPEADVYIFSHLPFSLLLFSLCFLCRCQFFLSHSFSLCLSSLLSRFTCCVRSNGVGKRRRRRGRMAILLLPVVHTFRLIWYFLFIEFHVHTQCDIKKNERGKNAFSLLLFFPLTSTMAMMLSSRGCN